ncbi:MAG: hypothetical protein KAS66_15965 [Candidatus Omnitrophica bacterium]|nr:hypothetical protein [Candidatus Omnitrophota bacterium]
MIYAFYAALSVVVFLEMLNSFQRGTKNDQLSIVLHILTICLIVASFIIAGWKLGLLAIALTFIFAVATRPLAARISSRIFLRLRKLESSYWPSKGRNCKYIGLPPNPLSRISNELSRSVDEFAGVYKYKKRIKKLKSSESRHDRAMKALLDFCEAQFEIQKIMSEFKISREDLDELYGQLARMGACQWACGHWVAASSIAYPESLRYLLSKQESGTSVLREGFERWQETDKVDTVYNLIIYFLCGCPLKDKDRNVRV